MLPCLSVVPSAKPASAMNGRRKLPASWCAESRLPCPAGLSATKRVPRRLSRRWLACGNAMSTEETQEKAPPRRGGRQVLQTFPSSIQPCVLFRLSQPRLKVDDPTVMAIARPSATDATYKRFLQLFKLVYSINMFLVQVKKICPTWPLTRHFATQPSHHYSPGRTACKGQKWPWQTRVFQEFNLPPPGGGRKGVGRGHGESRDAST